MSSLGPYLRDLRERRGISLAEMSRATRVGRAYLEALEASEFGKLPAPAFTRGFIRAYCQAVGEPADEALSRYDNPHGARPEPSRLSSRQDAAARGRGALLVSFVLLVVLGVALFATTLVLQSGREAPPSGHGEAPSGEGRSTAMPPKPVEPADVVTAPTTPPSPPSPAPIAPPTPIGSVSSTPPRMSPAETPRRTTASAAPPSSATTTPATSGPRATPSNEPAPIAQLPSAVARATPTAPESIPSGSGLSVVTPRDVERAVGPQIPPYRLIARTVAPTWVRVRTEDGHSTEETIPPGETREWVSNRRFTVTVGNAGGVRFELNGRPLPPLGGSGVVIRRLVLPPGMP